jgi:hypothetical protein
MMSVLRYATVAILIWVGLGVRAAAPPASAPVEQLWADLDTADPVKADQAMARLVSRPAQTVPFLRRRLRPVAVDARRVAQCLVDLDSDRFRIRERASRELGGLADAVEPHLRQALRANPSPEVRRRIERLLRQLRAERLSPSPDRRRAMWAIEVLERIGDPEARQVLTVLARDAPAAALTIEAKAALERLVRPKDACARGMCLPASPP